MSTITVIIIGTALGIVMWGSIWLEIKQERYTRKAIRKVKVISERICERSDRIVKKLNDKT